MLFVRYNEVAINLIAAGICADELRIGHMSESINFAGCAFTLIGFSIPDVEEMLRISRIRALSRCSNRAPEFRVARTCSVVFMNIASFLHSFDIPIQI
jgi:hypothetical protein